MKLSLSAPWKSEKVARVVARTNLPVQSKAVTLGLLYVIYSTVFNFSPVYDWAVGGLFVVRIILDIRLLFNQLPIDIFSEDKDNENSV